MPNYPLVSEEEVELTTNTNNDPRLTVNYIDRIRELFNTETIFNARYIRTEKKKYINERTYFKIQ